MQRFAPVGRGTGFICVTLAVLTVLGASWRMKPDLAGDGLLNPDSYMRLARLRDMLDSGTALFSVARDGSGHGTVLHWSHLLDSLLCVLALPFGLVLEPHAALHAAAVLFGPLNIAALGFAIAWAAAPFAERRYLWLGAVLAPLSPAISSYGVAGVVHHHVTIVIVAVAAFGWALRMISGRAPGGAGIALGAWIGVGVWFTPETVPLTMMAVGAIGLAWIIDSARADLARGLGLCGLSFAVVTVLALLADPPAAGIGAPEIDRLSVLFAGLALAVAGSGAGVWLCQRWVAAPGPRVAAACAIGGVCCALWAVVFRDALFHSNMALDPAEWDAFFGHIAEMLPVGGLFSALQFLLTGLWAVLLVATLAIRRRSPVLAYGGVCLAGLLLIGWSHVRFSAYPEAAGAIALPVTLTLVGAATARWHQIGQSFVRMAVILLFIQVPYLGQLPDLTAKAHAAESPPVPACLVSDAVGMLASRSGAVVLAEVSDTPELLVKTGVRTVGSLYHRNVAGFARLRAAWRAAPSDAVPAEIETAGISLVLACHGPVRSPLVEDLARATLADQVRTGHPPPWLVRIDVNPASGHVLYAVRRVPGDAARLAPGDAVRRTPGDTAGRTPEDAAGLTPGDAVQLAPGDAAGLTPGDASGRTPGDTAGRAPGDPAGRTPENAARPEGLPHGPAGNVFVSSAGP